MESRYILIALGAVALVFVVWQGLPVWRYYNASDDHYAACLAAQDAYATRRAVGYTSADWIDRVESRCPLAELRRERLKTLN